MTWLVLADVRVLFSFLRWFDVPSGEVELGNSNESLQRIVNLGHWEESVRMSHEAANCQHTVESVIPEPPFTDFVMRSSILLGSRMNVGRVTRLRSAPGRSWLMMWERTVASISIP